MLEDAVMVEFPKKFSKFPMDETFQFFGESSMLIAPSAKKLSNVVLVEKGPQLERS